MVKSDHKVLTPRSTNTAPVFKDADGDEIADDTNIAREVDENTPEGEPVGDPVVAVDSEGDVLTYTLGGNGDVLDLFEIERSDGPVEDEGTAGQRGGGNLRGDSHGDGPVHHGDGQ